MSREVPLVSLQNRSSTSEVTTEELCGLMQIRGINFKEAIDRKYESPAALCIILRSSVTEGISDDSVCIEQQRQRFGSNAIPLKKSKALWQLILQSLKEPTLVILEIAALLSLGLSLWIIFRPGAKPGPNSYDWIEAVAIAIAVFVIVLVSATNDYGKETQFRALQKRVREEHKALVVRNGHNEVIPAQEVVVGEICCIKYGDVIPADGILLQSQELKLDESSVTGESEPAKKHQNFDCRLLSGTNVVEGCGKMLVLATGVNSQAGSVYKLLGVLIEKNNPRLGDPFASDELMDSGSSLQETSELDLHTFSPICSNGANPVQKITATERKMLNHSVFQSKLTVLAKQIGIIGFTVALGTALVIIIRFCVQNYVIDKHPWKMNDTTTILDGIIIGITILVIAIPEGLPLAVTLTLALSAKKMMRDNSLVRHLYSCETMGCATTICSDKTGTLTTNRMTVTASWFGDAVHHPLPTNAQPEFLSLLCTTVIVSSSYGSEIDLVCRDNSVAQQCGNTTECALLQLVNNLGWNYNSLRNLYPENTFAKVYTFNSFRKLMATVVCAPGGFRVFCKGAAEIVFAKCDFIITETGCFTSISAEDRQTIASTVISNMASSGLRTVCVAYRDIFSSQSGETFDQLDFENEAEILSGLTCLAVFGIEDPVRPEVPKAIRSCQRAGITVRMITGDNVRTARAVALKCGIIHSTDEDLVLESEEFNKLARDESGEISQKKLDEIWPRLKVLAESTPLDKFNLVQGIVESKISKNREVVAVTGDGANDAPALKKADIGFAMGINGTDIAKEASDIILLDDNFTSIVKACMWGRNIYENVAKFLQFQLTVNTTALIVAIVSSCVLGDTPLKAVPMLWINMIMDTLASLALATEPPSEALLKRKPYGRTKNIISSIMLRNILWQSAYQTTVLLTLQFAGPRWLDLNESDDEPSDLDTLIFTTLVLMSAFNLVNSRCIHNEINVFKGTLSNKYFAAIWLLILSAQILIVHFGGYAFSTLPLPLDFWMISFAFGVGSLLWYQGGGFLWRLILNVTVTRNWFSKINLSKIRIRYEEFK